MKTFRIFFIFFCLIFNQNLDSIEMSDRWKLVTEDVKYGDSWYLDTESFMRKNGFLHVYILVNYQIKQNGGYHSIISRWMIDCDLMGHKYLALTSYEKKFGAGNVIDIVSAKDMNEWQYPPPRSNGYLVEEFACANF